MTNVWQGFDPNQFGVRASDLFDMARHMPNPMADLSTAVTNLLNDRAKRQADDAQTAMDQEKFNLLKARTMSELGLNEAQLSGMLQKQGFAEQEQPFKIASLGQGLEQGAENILSTRANTARTESQTAGSELDQVITRYGFGKEQATDQQVALAGEIDKRINSLPPELREQAYNEASSTFGSDVANQTGYGKQKALEAETRMKAEAKGLEARLEEQGKLSAFAGMSNSPGNLAAMQAMNGDLVWMRNPQTGGVMAAPKSQYGKNTPSNEADALKVLSSDRALFDRLGFGQETTKTLFGLIKTGMEPSALSKKVKDLPETDQQLLGITTKIMQTFANPRDALQMIQNAVNQTNEKNLKGTKSQEDLILTLDRMLMNLGELSTGNPMSPHGAE